jgi:predicted nuclease with TOPRIM domain
MTEELMRLRKHRDSLEAFIGGPAHAGYVAARQEELRLVKETILELDPVSREDEVEQYKLRGEKRCLEGMLSVFADALEDLKDRIDEIESEDLNDDAARHRGERTTPKRERVLDVST